MIQSNLLFTFHPLGIIDSLGIIIFPEIINILEIITFPGIINQINSMKTVTLKFI